MTSWSLTAWLRRRLLLLMSGLWISTALVAVFVGTNETNSVFDDALESVADVVALLAPADASHIDAAAAAKLEELALAGNRAGYVSYQIRSTSGSLLHRSTRAPDTPYPVPTTPGFTDIGAVRYFTKPLGADLVVQVSEQPKERRGELLRLLATFLLPLLALLIAAFVLATRLAAAVGDALVTIAAQVQARGGQSLEPLERAGLPTELQPVVDDINLMLGRLRKALEAERSFSANCAHELRNPIAAARAQADLVAEKLAGGAEHNRLVQLSQALARLGGYIERLLQMNRAEAGFALSGQSCDLVDVTRLLMDEYARRPSSANRIDLDDGGLTQLRVAIDQDALAIALRNLLDNAIAYGDPGTEIQVRLAADASVSVCNDAAVLSPEQLDRLSRRFERGEQTGPGSFGLGLSIVKQIVSQTGGRLELHSPVPGRKDGFLARLVLPPASGETRDDNPGR